MSVRPSIYSSVCLSVTLYILLAVFDQLWSILLLYILILHLSNCAVYYLLVCYISLMSLPHNEICHLFMIYSYLCPTVQCATYLYIILMPLPHCAVYHPLYFTCCIVILPISVLYFT